MEGTIDLCGKKSSDKRGPSGWICYFLQAPKVVVKDNTPTPIATGKETEERAYYCY